MVTNRESRLTTFVRDSAINIVSRKLAWTSPNIVATGMMMLGIVLISALSVKLTPLIGIVFIAVLIIPTLFILFIRHPRLWLYSVVLVLPLWFPQKGDADSSISIVEYLLVGFYIGGLALWFFIMLVICRKKIIRHVGDTALVLVIVASALNFFIAFVNDVPPLEWFRDWLLFVFLLYYFPIREHIQGEREIYTFSALLTGAMLVVGGMTFYRYMLASSNIFYAYQLVSSRQNANNNMSVIMSLFAMFVALYSRKKTIQSIALFLTIFFFTLTIVSFARAFIISTVAALLAILVLFDIRKIIRMVIYGIVAIVVFFGALQVLFHDKSDIVLKVIGVRIGSSSKGTQDKSLQSRISESMVMSKEIRAHPFAGNGLGATFSFYDPISNQYAHAKFVHNGYIFIAFKFGLPFFILFYTWYGYVMYRSYTSAVRAENPMHKAFMYATVASLLALLVINVTSCVFEVRDGFFMIAFVLGVAASIEQKIGIVHTSDQKRQISEIIPLLGITSILTVFVLIVYGLFIFYL